VYRDSIHSLEGETNYFAAKSTQYNKIVMITESNKTIIFQVVGEKYLVSHP